MPTRRIFIASAIPAALSVPSLSAQSFAEPGGSFADFVSGVRAEARREGIRPATLDRAFAGVVPNQKVLDRDHHQPESTWTWARYRGVVITDKRISDGREAFAANRALFQRVDQHYGVGAGVIAGIWGLESSFGTGTGDFRVVEALDPCLGRPPCQLLPRRTDGGAEDPRSWRRRTWGHDRLLRRGHGSAAIHAEQLSALCGRFRGPRASRHLDQQGRRAGLDRQLPGAVRLARQRDLGSGSYRAAYWTPRAVMPNARSPSGHELASVRSTAAGPHRLDTQAGLVAPDGAGGDAFVVFGNFAAIRRYNPSDFYAIAVGLIGDQVVT